MLERSALVALQYARVIQPAEGEPSLTELRKLFEYKLFSAYGYGYMQDCGSELPLI